MLHNFEPTVLLVSMDTLSPRAFVLTNQNNTHMPKEIRFNSHSSQSLCFDKFLVDTNALDYLMHAS